MLTIPGKNYESEIARLVSHYIMMRDMTAGSTMYRETMWQYGDMAHGRDGGPASRGKTIREEYYSGYPDEFFLEVLTQLGESETFLLCGASAHA